MNMLLDISRPFDTVELSHELVRGMPNHPSHPAYNIVPYYRFGDFELNDGYWGCNELIMMSGHTGTHLDALGHVAASGLVFGGQTAKDIVAGIDGLAANGIETVRPIVRRGVLIDAARQAGVPRLAPDTPITAADVDAAAGRAGVTIQEGDCVLIRTGWSTLWTAPNDVYQGTTTGLPGIDRSAADWLADRGVFLVGSDTSVVEHARPGMHALPVHLDLLAKRGVHLLENMNLESMATRDMATFLFVCLPLRLHGSSGSPVRPIAIVQEQP